MNESTLSALVRRHCGGYGVELKLRYDAGSYWDVDDGRARFGGAAVG
jgi:hypothetical protein